MTSPIRPLPHEVGRWISLAAWFRWGDAAVAWISLWPLLAWLVGLASAPAAVASLVLVALGALTHPVRVLWRPISGGVGLAMSRGLQPGDRAWYVRSRHADPVLVTARHGARMRIATPDLDEPDEVLSVRRTRVLLIPADHDRPTS
jgi:hypothetical protein